MVFDDILIFSVFFQKDTSRPKEVFERLKNENFKIQLDKYEFCQKNVEYLSPIIAPEGPKPNSNRISKIFINNFAGITKLKLS